MFNFNVKGDLVNYEGKIMINKCVYLHLEVEKNLNLFFERSRLRISNVIDIGQMRIKNMTPLVFHYNLSLG
jgi:hypothetical protein